jgi:hypothetical protein
MKLDEIFDRNDPEYQRRFAAALKSVERMYAPPKRRSPEEEAKRKADWDQYKAKRDSIEKIAGEVAAKYSGEQFDQFKTEVMNLIPADDLKMIDLQSVWNIYNPDRMELSRKSWEDYGRKRAAHDPSVTGIGPGGARNWTGD